MFLLPKSVRWITFLVLVLTLLTPFLIPQSVHAGSLMNTSVALNRLSQGSPIAGITCARPSTASAGTEGRISITFPADFSLNTTPSNWATSTTGIPSGTTAWPGISTSAISVSGTTVTFNSSDLTTTNTYCFTFQGSSSTIGSGGGKNGVLTTLTSGNTPIDTTTYAMTVTDDQIDVSAIVAASPTDYTATLTQTAGGSQLSQNQTATYQLEYSSSLMYATPVTLEINWTDATGGVEIADYVIGSASNAYGNAPPVIDTVNQTITWTIPSFPGNTPQAVNFSLRTNDSYQGTNTLSFQVTGRLQGVGIQTPDSTITNQYQYVISVAPTATPGQSTNTSPTPATPSTLSPFIFTSVSMRTVTDTEASMRATTSLPALMTVSYGLDPSEMNATLTGLTQATSQLFTFPDLSPGTQYYFRIEASDSNGRQITSDIFTFTTATSSVTPIIDLNSLIVTSGNTIIFIPDYRAYTGGQNFIIVPPERTFEIQFGFEKNTEIKAIQLLVRSGNVLAASTTPNELAAIDNSPMLEVKPGIFIGRLLGKTQPGYYEVLTRIEDYQGNIVEEKLTDLKVSKPFLIQGTDRKPIENAKVTLSLFNEKTRIFEPISPESLAIQNPTFSDTRGIVPVVLPMGTYRAEVQAFGKIQQEVTFTIGILPEEDYPVVTLQSGPFSVTETIHYFAMNMIDSVKTLLRMLDTLVDSKRSLELVGFLTVSIFSVLLLLSLRERTHVSIKRLPVYLLSLLTIHRGEKEKEHVYRGVILDGLDRSPLIGVDVFVTDQDTGEIVFHTKSTKLGKITLPLPPKESYLLTLEKVGFHTATCPLTLFNGSDVQTFALLGHNQKMKPHIVFLMVTELLHRGFEFLLIMLLLLSLLLSFSFGLIPVLPFILLALFNIIVWMLHTIHQHSQ